MFRQTTLSILLVGVFLCCANRVKAVVTLVSDGRPRAVIVLPAKPSRVADEGAKILTDHIQQISGARLKVMRENEIGQARVVDGRIETASGTSAAETFILVGESDLANELGAARQGLGPGGILIRTIGNALVLLGPDDSTPSDPYGSRYAVTTFLEQELGCRYLWPGETGKVVPKRTTITVNSIHVRFTPLLKQRNVRWSGYSSRIQEGLDRLGFTREDFLKAGENAARTQSESSDWMAWHRMGGSLGLKTGDGTILSAETWDKFLREHPEWFAMQLDGLRYFDASWERPRLCKSNLALIEAIAREKIKELERSPAQKSVSLMTQDGGSKAGFCMCPECKALDPLEGRPTQLGTYDHKSGRCYRFDYVSLTDRMMYFYNAIAEKVAKVYPEVLFTGQAYSVYRAPPVKQKLHPNIVIRFVHSPSHYADDEARDEGMADWDAWARAAQMIYWRPNSLLWSRHEGTLGVYAHKLGQDFRHISGNKCVGTDFDSCMHHWATQGLNYYVLAKLNWYPDLDVDEVIDDYCRCGFLSAAGEIKRYLLRVEQLTDQAAAQRNADVTEPYTPQVIAELGAMLDAADKAAGDDSAVRRRIAFLRAGLDFTELQAKIYRLLAVAGQRSPTAEQKSEAKQLLDAKYLRMREIFQREHFAVNVAALCWGEWGRFKRLGWTGPSGQR